MHFGVLGTAGIARSATIPAIQASEHTVQAIASRDSDRAAAVAEEAGIPDAYGSYADLIAAEGIDAVYVPVPNALHAEWTKRAADAGLHVLCEKPLAATAAEAREVVEHCADRGVTLMEAFMYRYHPRTERAVEIAREELGGIRHVTGTFRFALRGNPENVRLSPDLAGGSLMDVGCYPVHVARTACGEPERVHASATDSRDCGVDTQFTGVLEFGEGVTATVQSGFDTALTHHYHVEGTEGRLTVENAFDTRDAGTTALSYEVDGRAVTESFDPADAFRHEIEHFAECVESGDSPRTHGESAVRNMAVIDALKASAEQGGEPVAVDVP